MDYKFCNECGTKNVSTGKYCYTCGNKLVELDGSNKAVNIVSKIQKSSKQTVVLDFDENEDDIKESLEGQIDTEFTNQFANLVIAKGGVSQNKGVKIEDVFNTAKGNQNRKALSKRKNTGAKSAKAILKEGANTREVVSRRGRQSEE